MEVQIGWQGLAMSQSLGKNSSLPLLGSDGCQQSLAFLGLCKDKYYLHLHLHTAIFLCVSVSLSPNFLLTRTPVILDLEPTVIPENFILT